MQRGVGPEAGGTLLHLPGITAASVTHASGTVPAECAEPGHRCQAARKGRAQGHGHSQEAGLSPPAKPTGCRAAAGRPDL